MGRKGLGVSSAKYWKMPHVEGGPPRSLWWYRRQPAPAWADDIPTLESQKVIDEYLRQRARGRRLPSGFEANLARCLQDLSRPEKISPRRERYWSIPAYALAHDMEKATLMKRLRELERIAISLFPIHVPTHRKPRPPLTDKEKQSIRQRY